MISPSRSHCFFDFIILPYRQLKETTVDCKLLHYIVPEKVESMGLGYLQQDPNTPHTWKKRERSTLYFSPTDSINITKNRKRGIGAPFPLYPLSPPRFLSTCCVGEDVGSSSAARERRRWSTCDMSATLLAQPCCCCVFTCVAPLPQRCTTAKDEVPQHRQAVLRPADHPHLHHHLLPFGRQIDGDDVVRWG
jgi:hypothetical protein